MLSKDIASESYYVGERFAWLINTVEGLASCLPFDNNGQRVSQTLSGKRRGIQKWMMARVREENWARRGVIVLFLLERSASACDELVMSVVDLAELGVFQHVCSRSVSRFLW